MAELLPRPRNMAEEFPSTSSAVQYTSGLSVPVWGVNVPEVSRELALSVPGILRGVTLIATTIAGLPIERIDSRGQRVELGWLRQPEAGRPRFATIVDTVTDLIVDGRAYWRIIQRDGGGAPAFGGCEYIALHRVGDITLADGGHTITIDGKVVDPRDVIAFEGIHNGIRRHGARLIRTALALEAAAKRYADTPMPSVTLVNESGYVMDDDEIDATLAEYKAARNQEGVGYVKDLKPVITAWDAAQMQLVEARQYTNTLIAALLGLPEQYIPGSATSAGGAIRYQNVTQDARALIDYGLKQWIGPFEARLSMTDIQGAAWSTQVTPRGTTIRVVLDGLLRGNTKEQAEIAEILIRSGVITPEQADFIPKGQVPA
jgi:phage portal protein BeeE